MISNKKLHNIQYKEKNTMSIVKNLTLLLPDFVQDRLMAKVIRSNKWKTVPTFQMLFESYVMMGAEKDDLLRVFSAAKDMGIDLYRNARETAEMRLRKGDEFRRLGNRGAARLEYQKAVMLYFVADWVMFEEDRVAENYHDLLAASAKVDVHAEIPTEKVFLIWRTGHIACRFRLPDRNRYPMPEAGYPLVMIHQGNDTVKEALLLVEDELLEHRLAVLNLDPAGWGESRLSGNRLRSMVDAPLLVQRVEEFLDTRPEIDGTRIAVYGFSGGGTWSAMYASVSERVKCMVNVGGGILNLGKLLKGLPAMQKRQVMKHWGCSEEDIPKIAGTINFDLILPRIEAQCLLVHGSKDSLMPVEYIRKAAQLIMGKTDLVVVPGGNHMCSKTLKQEQLPMIGDWFMKHL